MPSSPHEKSPLIPRISGPWRKLYKPEKYGCYVNDHSLIQDRQTGLWHLFGITRKEPQGDPSTERYFTHGVDGIEAGMVCDFGETAWAPAVIDAGDRYLMFYGPDPTKLAVSKDLKHWQPQPVHLHNSPPGACNRDHMLIKGPNGTWLMYATGLNDGLSAISVFESNDLTNWNFKGFALRTGKNAPLHPAWGATESPFVVTINGLYYLFVTYTDCKPENYHNTLIFVSNDPLNFGDYLDEKGPKNLVAHLQTHAPEIFQDPISKEWSITSCGWLGFNTPVEGGVAVAKLEWD